MSKFVAAVKGFAVEALPLRFGKQINLPIEGVQICDIGANLVDEMFLGVYNEKQRHEPDLLQVLERAKAMNVNKIVCTAGSMDDSRKTLDLLRSQADPTSTTSTSCSLSSSFGLTCTVGVHPTRSDEFKIDQMTPEEHEEWIALSPQEKETQSMAESELRADKDKDELALDVEAIDKAALRMAVDESRVIRALRDMILEGNNVGNSEEEDEVRMVVAVGECGLDYARLRYCSKERQKEGFVKQLYLASELSLPLFLHSRDTDGDFLRIFRQHADTLFAHTGKPLRGVVHSYDGNIEEMLQLCELGLFIGINGCSLRSEDNLQMVAEIPQDRLLLETDAPWCGIKKTHPSHPHVQTVFAPAALKKKEKHISGYLVKDRNEPCFIHQVLEVVAAQRGLEPAELAAAVWENSQQLFFGSGK